MEKVSLSGNLKINVVSETATTGTFEIEGLYSGYGITLGNSLRRVLFSSIAGAAISQVKIKGVGHEFTTIPGVLEDVVEMMHNLKKVRFAFLGDADEYDAPEIVSLKSKGEGEVVAGDIKRTSLVRVVNPDLHIATISQKGVELDIELTVEKGLGYVPVEALKGEALPVGVIQLDAIFSPVRKVNFTVEIMRVGERTDFNRLHLIIETDGTKTPVACLVRAVAILQNHFIKISDQLATVKGVAIEAASVTAINEASDEATEVKKPKKRATKKKKEE